MKYTKRIILAALLPLITGMVLSSFLLARILHDSNMQRLEDARQALESSIVRELQGRIETAYAIVSYCYHNKIDPGTCRQMLNTVRFGKNNYIWVHVMSPTNLSQAYMIVHPENNLVDRDLSGMIDLDNISALYYRGEVYPKEDPAVAHIAPTDLFTEFNTACTKHGQGVVRYYWPKIINGKASPEGYLKMSFVKYFAPWNWVLGAGEYADHIDTEVAAVQESLSTQNRYIFQWLTGIVGGTLAIFGVLALALSRRIAASIDSYEQKLLESHNKLQASEQRFHDMAFSSGDIIWETDNEGQYVFIAGDTERILGYRPAELLGRTIYDLHLDDVHGEDEPPPLIDLIKTGKPIVDIEYIHVTRYNQQIVMLINGLPVLDTAGQVIGYRGVARDITDRKKEDQKRMVLELELRQAQRLESIGTLAAGVAHEINSPAQFINDNLHFLKDSIKSLGHYTQDCRKVASENEDLTARQQAVNRFDLQYDTDFLLNEIPQAIAQSLEGIDQIRQIVSAMKDFSHMGQGERVPAHLHNAIENAITISRNEWKSVAEVELDFCETLPAVPCFIAEIKQVILNLVINAAHSIEDAIQEHLLDKGKITIRTHHDDAFAYIDITDTGTGIPEKNHTRIFDHFFTTKEVGRGTGQGLAMAYQTITEKHRGKISFDTAINVGTTFHIKLPLT